MRSMLSSLRLQAQGVSAKASSVKTLLSFFPLAAALLAFVSATGVSAQTCPHIPNGGGESMSAWVTVKNTGAAVAGGAVLPAGTEIRLDSVATANGSCRGRALGETGQCADTPFTYERTVNHTDIWADISTATPLNGTYTVGYVSGRNPDGSTADLHVLDTTSSNSSGPIYATLSYPGVYRYHFRAIINTTPCDIQPDRTETVTVTVHVREKDDNGNSGPTDCQTEVGEPINVTNGNMYIRQTDYGLPGAGGGLSVTRTYNSHGQNKRTGIFGYGWSSELDESLTAYGALGLSLNLPDGRAVFFGRTSASAPYLPKAAPDFHAQITRNPDNSYTLTFRDGSVHQFNAAGKLLSKTDHNGNLTGLTYDANGKLVSVTDPGGRTLSLTYGGNGLVSSLADQLGNIATYAYGFWGRLDTVTYPDGSKYRFTDVGIGNAFYITTVWDAYDQVLEHHEYDSQGRATLSRRQAQVERYTLSYVSDTETHVTDALGRVTKYFLDKSRGRNVVTRVEGACGCGSARTQAWAYDDRLNLTSETDALGQTTNYTYDADGNPLTVTDALGTTVYTYNALGHVLTATDPMGGVTTNTYDARGNLLTTKNALNHTTTLTYDGRGLPLSVTDARNNTTSFTYDASGNLITRTNTLNQAVTMAYDARGRLTGVTDAGNRTSGFAYDPAGRLKTLTLPDNSTVTYTYDLAGRRTKVTDARGNSTNYTYDTAYRVTSVKDAANNITSYAYDLMSNLTGETDALGRTTNYTYDDLNRLTKITHPEASAGAGRLEETFAYDAAGNLTRSTDRAGRATVYAYDTSGRLVSTTDPAQKVTGFEYNARSQRTAVVDALGQRYEFDYDALGRVTQTRRGGGAGMSFLYDAAGNRTRRTDYNGAATNYTYDALNRLTLVSYPNGSTAAYGYDTLSRLTTATNVHGTVTIGYDSRDRVSSVLDVSGQAVGYTYDVNGNQTGLSLGASTHATYQYDNLDRLTQLTNRTGAAFTFGYDAAGRPASRTAPNGVATTFQYDGLDRLTRLKHLKGATTLADYQYQLNAASNVTQVTEPAGARAYGYDTVDRLTSAAHPNQQSESYAYDAVGNRTASHLAGSYGYQPANRLATAGPTAYSYDANGNLVSKTDGGGTWQYVWDYENQLTQVTRPDGQIINYKYDALGKRIERGKGGAWTRFSYDGDDVVLDADSGGGTVEYLNGLKMDEKLSLRVNGGSALYFVTDHLSSTRALADGGGSVVEATDYDSFGRGPGSAVTRYGYTGRELDADTGLYYYRARWYDPQAGRFVSEDPIVFAGGINMYAYVGGNPLAYTDPTGLVQQSCCRKPQLPPIEPAHKVPAGPRPVPAPLRRPPAPLRPPGKVIPFPIARPIGAPALGWTAAVSAAIIVPAIIYRIHNPLPGSQMNPLPPPRMGETLSCVGGPYRAKPFPDPGNERMGPCEVELSRCLRWANDRPTEIDPYRNDIRRCMGAYKECIQGLIPDWPHKPMPTF